MKRRDFIYEMLLYSRPGVIEMLPALPPLLQKGSNNGMLARSIARVDKLKWDMETTDTDVHLPENKPVSFQLKLGHRNPFDWVEQVARS